MQANVPIMTNEECRRIYTEPSQIPNHMMCTSSASSDACEGDNGGPLVVKSKEDGAWYQAGIVSWRR
ncbi:putative Transmembrane Protease serine 9, partial [Daphnia magna]